MADAGWFPDPQYPGSEVFFDGQAWTQQRRPAQPPTAAPTSWDAPPAAPTLAMPVVDPHAYPPSAYQPAGHEQTGYPPAYPPGPEAAWQPPPPAPAPRRNRKPLLLALVAVAALAAGLITWLAWPDDAPNLTFEGKEIAAPADVLTKAESGVDALVASRHGAANADTRCYYAHHKDAAAGTKKSDVDAKLRCGPVLFVDGDAAKAYLAVPLSSDSTGGKVTLTAQQPLTGLDPEAVDDTLELVRPDGKSAPDGSGGLTVPDPPAADKDVLTSASLGSAAAPATLSDARIVGKTTGFTLTAAGEVKRYGSGDDARSAPKGQKLVAFQLDYGAGDVSGSGAARAGLVVDGGSPRTVPDTTGTDDWVIAAVPTSGSAVLQLADGGYRQSLSLPDGKPGSGNLAVLGRRHRTAVITKSASVPIHLSNGSGSADVTFHARASFASLDFWIPGHTDKHAKDANHAILSVRLNYTDTASPGQTFGFDPQLLQLRLPSGGVIRSRNVATGNKIYDVFDVPADFTKGTVQVSGTEKVSGVTVRVRKTVSFPVSIPAG